METYSETEFLRPLVTGWLGKIALAKRDRSHWQNIADECHDDKTEVLTSSGWTPFCQLIGDELLATVNLDTDTIEYQKPTRLTRRPASGDMVRFKSKTLNALVTNGHRMICYSAHSDQVKIKEAKDILRSDRLKLTAKNWNGTDPVLPDFLSSVDLVDFAEWLGFYIAEGWCCSREKQVGYRFGVAQAKLSGREYYESLISRLPGLLPDGSSDARSYTYSNKDMWEYLSPFGNCYTKRVPEWIKCASQAVIRAFLRGYIAGDGHVSEDGMTVTSTASKLLADDIQELWIKVGRSASIRDRSPAPYEFVESDGSVRRGMSGVLYLVTAWKEGKKASLKRHNGNEIELYYKPESYRGMVYCATVPNGSLITRRGGVPLISGNCMMFYARSAAAMWDQKYGRKFWNGVPAPRFRVTINKAFEMVAVFGPSLMWGYPHRQVESKRQIDYPIELFGDPDSPDTQQFYEGISKELEGESAQDRVASELMERWLNYTVHEQPGGGLAEHSMQAVTDALIKGRGVLWTKPYRFPASSQTLTGSFREPPENLYVDPDYKTLDDAKWIAIRRVEPTWEVERRFKLKKDSLKNRSTLESSWSEAELRTSMDYTEAKLSGQSNDMMVYYEVWSKSGAGSRLTGMEDKIKDQLEETVGDYAWIVVAPNVPYPLNCPSEDMRAGATSADVASKFEWPIDCWADHKWPITVLDFYENPDSSWPVAPLAPAMGELKFLNVMIPHLMNRIWSSSRDFWMVAANAYSEFLEHLQRGEDQTVFKIPNSLGGSVKDHIGVLQQPQTNMDVWRIIEAVSEMFDKRTGLTDFLYGTNTGGTQDRTAETTMARRTASGVRPQYMQERVKSWQSNVAALEAFCARMFIKGGDVQPLLGNIGAGLWEQMIMSSDVEKVARQMKYTIAASSIQRPDKEKEAANMSQGISIWLPVAQAAAASSGDYTAVNGIMEKWGEAVGVYTGDIEIVGADPNQESDMQQQMEQQRAQLEMQKGQMDLQAKQMDLQGKQIDLQGKAMQAKAAEAKAAMDLQSKVMESQLDLQGKAAESQAEQESMAMDSMKQEQDLIVDGVKAGQELAQDAEMHNQDYKQNEELHRQKMKHLKELNDMKTAITRWSDADKKRNSGDSKQVS